MKITINIKDEESNRIIDGVAYQYDYQDTVSDPEKEGEVIPNPETKEDFVKRMTIEWLKENVKAYEVNKATDTARDDATDKFYNEISLN